MVIQVVLAFSVLTGVSFLEIYNKIEVSTPSMYQECLYLSLLVLHIMFGAAVHFNHAFLLKVYTVFLTGHFFFVVTLAVHSVLDLIIAGIWILVLCDEFFYEQNFVDLRNVGRKI